MIFLDNSCWGLTVCDRSQNPGFPDAQGNAGQFDYLRRNATDATRAGKQVFVVMHIPTRDPRDQSYVEATTFNHVMGKGLNPAEGAGQRPLRGGRRASPAWMGCWWATSRASSSTRGQGDIPYYIDGGAGGGAVLDRAGGCRPRLLARLPAVARGRGQGDRRHRADLRPGRDPARGARLPGAREPTPSTWPSAASRSSTSRSRCPDLELRDPDPVRPASAGLGRWAIRARRRLDLRADPAPGAGGSP